MEKASNSHLLFIIKTYFSLTKPGIIFGNTLTAAGGFLLASRGQFNGSLFLVALLGLGLIIASGCVANNYIDRDIDKKMKRTRNRALVKGLVSPFQALVFAIVLGSVGISLLTFFVNFLSASIALLGFVIYVLFYSFLKYHSVHATLVGSIAGAVPPVIGYCAVSNHFDTAALILFIIISTWQMPHFFAIATYRIGEYTAASIPVLPIKKGMYITKIHMLAYILAFMVACFTLTIFGYTGYGFLVLAALLGIGWLCLCFRGFKCTNDAAWAREMFVFSLVAVMTICFMIPFSVL